MAIIAAFMMWHLETDNVRMYVDRIMEEL